MTKADPSVRNGRPRGVIGPNVIAERTAKRSSATAVTGAKPDATRRTQILKAANAVIATWSGYIRPDVDLRMLADRMCQSMLHVAWT
jgi:hypothetical protein